MIRSLLPVLTAVTALACACDASRRSHSMDAGGRADAGHDADGSDPLPVPEPPRLSDWACPEGWLPSPYGEGEPWAFSACAPPVRRECDGASRQLPGEAECRRLGTPCPETEDGLPTEADLRSLAPGFEGEIRYVRAEAPGGGDGSRDAPFSTLADALERPGSGVIVALAPGVHRARAAVRGSVAVVGSCVGETTVQALPLRGGELPYQATLLLGDGDVLATNLRLTGARVGIRVENGLGTATVRSVLVEAAAWVGIIVIRSSPGILLEDVVVRDVVPPPADRFAAGLVVTESGGVRLRGAVVERNADIAVVVLEGDGEPGPDLTIEDLAVADTGLGVSASGSAHLVVRRTVVDGVLRAGVSVDHADGPTLELEDVVVRGTLRHGRNPWSAALRLHSGAQVSGRRLLLEDNEDACGWLLGLVGEAPTRVSLEDVVCRGSHAGPGNPLTAGLAVFGASEAALERVLFEGNAGLGAFATSRGEDLVPELTLTDVVVRETQELALGEYGGALEVTWGAQARMTRAVLEHNHHTAVLSEGWGRAPETRVTLEDVAVRDTALSRCGVLPDDFTPERHPWACVDDLGRSVGGGIGLAAVTGGRLTVTGFEVTGAAQTGVVVAREALFTARRGVITGNAIGLNVLADGFDADESLQDVYIFGNGTDVGRVDMPLPGGVGTPVEVE